MLLFLMNLDTRSKTMLTMLFSVFHCTLPFWLSKGYFSNIKEIGTLYKINIIVLLSSMFSFLD